MAAGEVAVTGPARSDNDRAIKVFIPSAMWEWLAQTAHEEKTSVSELVRAGIERMISAHGPCGVAEIDEEMANMLRWRWLRGGGG